ncbi:MAG: protein-L-isoaspartate O-methyltransferase [Spirochaetales bacterium]|nr:protein-L-isoaspartate O-methyltransferase [Spirochaetales bacterium]
MPSCKVCGIDIPEPGLCAECKEERAAARKKPGKTPRLKPNTRFLLVIAACTALVIAGIIIIIALLPSSSLPTSGQPPGQTPGMEQGLDDSPAAGAETGTEDTGPASTDISAASSAGSQEQAATDQGTDNNAPVAYDITQIQDQAPIDNKENYVKWMLAHTKENEASLSLRWERAQIIIRAGYGEFADKNALRAYLLTPRERFTRGQDLFLTYGDRPLQIGYGQTITAPNVMAMMTTSLKVEPQHKVLEIGTGSGYQAAVLARLTNHVYTIEIIEGLYKETDKLFKNLESDYPVYKNIHRKLDDGYYGWQEYAPFDRIIVTCSIDHLPAPLIKQLKVGGLIVVPLGPPYRQFLMSIEKVKSEDGKIKLVPKDVYDGLGVIFVPFTDSEGKSYSGE